jgi:Ca-activated chloride channel family protein
VLDALDGLVTSRGTAIGQAILTSLDAIAQIDPSVAPTGAEPKTGGAGYASSAIVVLTDGANTRGVDPRIAAQQAAVRRVRVFTIGFGTTTPAPMVCDNTQFDGGFSGRGGFGGFDRGRNPRTIDEPALRQIAATTGGSYHRAQNADQLQQALANLPGTFTVVHEQRDLAAWFAAAAATLIALATALTLWWNRPRSPDQGSGIV